MITLFVLILLAGMLACIVGFVFVGATVLIKILFPVLLFIAAIFAIGYLIGWFKG